MLPSLVSPSTHASVDETGLTAEVVTPKVRVEPGLNTPVDGREDWGPDGYLVYSKVCTHAGCPVGLYQQETHQLLCPCHQSTFDVLHGAKPVFGPAADALPQLPIRIDPDGSLVARGDFSDPVGPVFWRRT